MPDARVVVDALPSGNARKKRIHHDELLHFRWELCGVAIGDHQPYVVTDDSRLCDTEQLGKRMNTDRSGLHIQTIRRDFRVTNPGQVGCDHRESLGKQRNDRLPHS